VELAWVEAGFQSQSDYIAWVLAKELGVPELAPALPTISTRLELPMPAA